MVRGVQAINSILRAQYGLVTNSGLIQRDCQQSELDRWRDASLSTESAKNQPSKNLHAKCRQHTMKSYIQDAYLSR